MNPSTVSCTLEDLQELPLEPIPEGGSRLRFQAKPGLYQFSVIADASQFDWEELYIRFHCYGNKGQRTGPWDFNELDENKPLVPSYWVSLNGQRIGLWFFQRVSIEDIRDRRFRGRMAFHIARSGPATLEFWPYRPMRLNWMSARLEVDPEDRLQPADFPLERTARQRPCVLWGREDYWQRLRESLSTTHSLYAQPLQRAFDWICRKSEYAAGDIPLLFAAHALDQRKGALDTVLRIIDGALDLPAWSNPREDGYAHNGDMGAAETFRWVACAWHFLGAQAGAERKERMLEKLHLQGQRFFEKALLDRDYWGGSLRQDHGHRSFPNFGIGVLHMLGILPEASLWASYVIPRMTRGLEAMPLDGAVPPSSYGSLFLYLDELTPYRDTLLACGGEDIFQKYPFQKIVDYVIEVLLEDEGVMVVSGAQAPAFIGGNAFFNHMASTFRDGRAAHLQRRLLESDATTFFHPTQETAFFMNALWGFLSYDPSVPPVDRLERPSRLAYFQDSGLAHYRDEDIVLSVRCGPWCGYNAYRKAQGPSDRMESAPGAGHFILSQGAEPRLVTPEFSPYRLNTSIRSCLLIDDQGQYGDIGYPMSIPSKVDRGEEIERAHWNEASGEGVIRLKLGPAYPEELGVIRYTREFLIRPGRVIICRDAILLDQPRRLSWLFHGKREIGVALEQGLTARFGRTPSIRLTARAVGVDLRASIHETEIVWGYASENNFKPFDHVRYEGLAPVACATVDFVFNY